MAPKISSYLSNGDRSREALNRTPEELEQLIDHWLADPYWPLEEARGFEVHRQMLQVFRLEHELAEARYELSGLREVVQLLLGDVGPDDAAPYPSAAPTESTRAAARVGHTTTAAVRGSGHACDRGRRQL